MKKNNLKLHFDRSAIQKINDLMKKKNSKNVFFRIYIVGGGCSGFKYGFNFDKKQEDDYFLGERKVIIDTISAQYLSNASLYFERNLYGERFVIKNPNAKTTCGCGSSFSI